LLGVSTKTIHRLINAGKLPAVNLTGRSTRIRSTDLEAFFRDRRAKLAGLIPQIPRDDPKPFKRLLRKMTNAEPGSNVTEGLLQLANVEPIGVCGHSFSEHKRAG